MLPPADESDSLTEGVIRAVEARVQRNDAISLAIDSSTGCLRPMLPPPASAEDEAAKPSANNGTPAYPRREKTMYHSVELPGMDMRLFFYRLRKYSGASVECYAIACLYLDRLVAKRTGLHLDERSTHRLFAVALVLAAKARDDGLYSNTYYAKVVGVTVAALCRLEESMVVALDFELFVRPEEYAHYAALLSRSEFAGLAASPPYLVPYQLGETPVDGCPGAPASSQGISESEGGELSLASLTSEASE